MLCTSSSECFCLISLAVDEPIIEAVYIHKYIANRQHICMSLYVYSNLKYVDICTQEKKARWNKDRRKRWPTTNFNEKKAIDFVIIDLITFFFFCNIFQIKRKNSRFTLDFSLLQLFCFNENLRSKKLTYYHYCYSGIYLKVWFIRSYTHIFNVIY